MTANTRSKLYASLTATALLLCLLLARLAPATAQSGGGTATDGHLERAPIEQQSQVNRSEPAATVPQVTDAGCTIGTWQTVAPINYGRSRPALTYADFDGHFYLLGGEAAGASKEIPIEEYDPVAGTWTERANLQTGVSNAGAAAVGQYIYIPGGYSSSGGVNTLQRYNIDADTLTALAPMSGPLYAHAVVALNDEVYALGGNETGTAGTTNRIYTIATNSWRDGAPLPVAVYYATAVTDGTFIYVLGGNTTDEPTVQRYDPAADRWELLPEMGTGRGAPGGFFDGQNVWAVGGGWASYLTTTEYWDGTRWQSGPELNVGGRTLGAAFGNGVALRAGGWNGSYSDSAEILPISCPEPVPPQCTYGDWEVVNPINTARSRTSMAYAESTGRFYLLGGESSSGRDIPIEEYDPDNGTWSERSALLTGVSNTGAATVGDYIYVPGGYTGISASDAMQRYDPAGDTVITLSPLPAPNYAHAVVAHNQKIYVLGGNSNDQPGFTNYIYDPATDTWDSGSPLLTAVNYPAAASDGTYIYLLGGNIDDLITVQRYDPEADLWTEAPIMDSSRGGGAAFFDGTNVWAVGGGFYSQHNLTGFFDGDSWYKGPPLNVAARTLGAAYGDGLALKAGGWNGSFLDTAEAIEISCQHSLFLPYLTR